MCGLLASVAVSVRYKVKGGVRKRAQDVRYTEEKRFHPLAFSTGRVHQAVLVTGVPMGTANPGGVMAKEERRHCLWEHLPLGPAAGAAGLPGCCV